MSYFHKNPQVEDYKIRSERLCIPFSIVHAATPANKTSTNDLPACVVFAFEGQTAAAAAIDSGTSFTTPTDSTGVFGVLIYNLGTVQKVCGAATFNLSTGTIVATLAGTANGVTASGNAAVNLDWSGNLATTDLTGVFHLDYIISKA